MLNLKILESQVFGHCKNEYRNKPYGNLNNLHKYTKAYLLNWYYYNMNTILLEYTLWQLKLPRVKLKLKKKCITYVLFYSNKLHGGLNYKNGNWASSYDEFFYSFSSQIITKSKKMDLWRLRLWWWIVFCDIKPNLTIIRCTKLWIVFHTHKQLMLLVKINTVYIYNMLE